MITNIRNQAIYDYKFIKDINTIIQNYVFGNSKDNKSKELFKELEGLLLAKSEKPAEYILWLYEDKVDKYILYINTHPIKSLPKFPRFEFDDVLMLNF